MPPGKKAEVQEESMPCRAGRTKLGRGETMGEGDGDDSAIQ
jgi:hypothetical protein